MFPKERLDSTGTSDILLLRKKWYRTINNILLWIYLLLLFQTLAVCSSPSPIYLWPCSTSSDLVISVETLLSSRKLLSYSLPKDAKLFVEINLLKAIKCSYYNYLVILIKYLNKSVKIIIEFMRKLASKFSSFVFFSCGRHCISYKWGIKDSIYQRWHYNYIKYIIRKSKLILHRVYFLLSVICQLGNFERLSWFSSVIFY